MMRGLHVYINRVLCPRGYRPRIKNAMCFAFIIAILLLGYEEMTFRAELMKLWRDKSGPERLLVTAFLSESSPIHQSGIHQDVIHQSGIHQQVTHQGGIHKAGEPPGFSPGINRTSPSSTLSPTLKNKCQELIKGTSSENVKWAVNYKPPQEELWRHIHAANGTCEEFLHSGDYVRSALNADEEAFPLAYSIVTYKSPEQVERLLHAIYRPQNYYCIHVDAKSPEKVFNVLQRIADCLPNVFIPEVRHTVKWGTLSVILPELTCMKELLKRKGWKYFINLTGQEFPLKTNWEIVQILREFNGANDIIGSFEKQQLLRHRTDYIYKDVIHAIGNKEHQPHGINLTKGALHIIATPGYVDYVTNSVVAHDFMAWVENTQVPDETFFTSLNHNPQLGVPGSFTGTEDEVNRKRSVVRFKKWRIDEHSTMACTGKYRIVNRDICIVGVELLPTVTKSMSLFVNKLYIDVQPMTFVCLHDWLWDRVLKEYQNPSSSHIDVSYYRGLEFVQNHVMPKESVIV